MTIFSKTIRKLSGKRFTNPLGLFLGLCCLFPHLNGAILINEIQAQSSERLLRWSAEGIPRLGSGTAWNAQDFDDNDWKLKNAPFESNVRSELQGLYSLYLRRTFTASAAEASSSSTLRLSIDYNDGFVAYLNGKEIARRNLGREHGFVYWDQKSFNQRIGTGEESIIIGASSELLVEGKNVLAIQVHKENVNTTLSAKVRLTASTTLVGSSASWKYFVGQIEPSGGTYDPKLLNNSTYETQFTDWIELYNNGEEAVDLQGWEFRYGNNSITTWAFPGPDESGIPNASIMQPDSFLLVIADGLNLRDNTGTYFHTNFSLSAKGEFLALVNTHGHFVSGFPQEYPKQSTFHSYGIDTENGVYTYFEFPTPGTANTGVTLSGIVRPPHFNFQRGFHNDALSLTLTSDTTGASIFYTLDGSEPDENNGTLFTHGTPIVADRVSGKIGNIVRARAFHSSMIPSTIKTRTFLIGQDTPIRNIPALCISAHPDRSIYKPHGVTTIVGGSYPGGGNPTWQPSSNSDYNIAQEAGRPYERPASLELLDPNDPSRNFQIDFGLRIAASKTLAPRYRLNSLDQTPWPYHSGREKPSFNLFFRNDYEDSLKKALFPLSRVNEYKSLRLRSGKNDVKQPFIRDELMRRLHIDMEHVGAWGSFNSLYVNGELKGYYNLVEKLREPYFQKLYNSTSEWDVLHIDRYETGDDTAMNILLQRLGRNLAVEENYNAVTEMLDIANFADYMILNVFGATHDWPQNNFAVSRERRTGAKIQFHIWDAEQTFGQHASQPATFNMFTGVFDRKTGKEVMKTWHNLKDAEEFKILMADRIQKLFFSADAVLTEEHISERVIEMRDEINPIMQYISGSLMNEDIFLDWVPARLNALFDGGRHFFNEGYWPDIPVVTFNQHGGNVSSEFLLTLSASSGTIYYTVDGTDPRLFGGVTNPNAKQYSPTSKPTIEGNTTVKARVKSGSAWGAIQEASFILGLPAGPGDIVISEIMHRPLPAKSAEIEILGPLSRNDFEYIELLNINAEPVDISGLRFDMGITFDFTDSSTVSLGPNERIILVENEAAFRLRYGSDYPIGGQFGGRLGTSNERLRLLDANDDPIIDFTYNSPPIQDWPNPTGNNGHSLVLINPTSNPDHNLPDNWRSSSLPGGGPGEEEKGITLLKWRNHFFTEEERENPNIAADDADADKDGFSNFAEFAFATNPREMSTNTLPISTIDNFTVNEKEEKFLTLKYRYFPYAKNIDYSVLISSDLIHWKKIVGTDIIPVRSLNNDDGSSTMIIRDAKSISKSTNRYIRVIASPR